MWPARGTSPVPRNYHRLAAITQAMLLSRSLSPPSGLGGGLGRRPTWPTWVLYVAAAAAHLLSSKCLCYDPFDIEAELTGGRETDAMAAWARVNSSEVPLDGHREALCSQRWPDGYGLQMGFDCNDRAWLHEDRPWNRPSELHQMPFTIEVTTRRAQRFQTSSKEESTTCVGWLLSAQLVLVPAHCVGPHTTTDLPMSISLERKAIVRPVKPTPKPTTPLPEEDWRLRRGGHNEGQARQETDDGDDDDNDPATSKWGRTVNFRGTRVCWSRWLWDYTRPAAPFEMAMVKLDRPSSLRAPEPTVACLNSLPPPPFDWNRPWASLWNPKLYGRHCALIVGCRESSSGGAPHGAPYLQVTPVRAHVDSCDTYQAQVNGANSTSSRLASCFESPRQFPIRSRGLCKHETHRAIFCYKDTCPYISRNWPHTNHGIPWLVAVGGRGHPPTYKHQSLERANVAPDHVVVMADLRKMHNMLEDLALDTQAHTHGGSYRTVCRNLILPGGQVAPPPAPLHISSTGHQRRPSYALGDTTIRLEDIQVDAYRRSECWWNASELLPPQAFMCQRDGRHKPGPPDWPLQMHAERPLANRLPFLVELEIEHEQGPYITTTTSAQPPQPASNISKVEYSSHCAAYLINNDTVLAHSACVAPSNPWDRLLGGTVRAYTGALLPFLSPFTSRRASKACWLRARAPYQQFKPVELAMVRWSDPLEYKENTLKPLCLHPDSRLAVEPLYTDPGACSLVSTCIDYNDQFPWQGKLRPNSTWALPVYSDKLCRADLRVGGHPLPNGTRDSGYHAHQVACYRYDWERKIQDCCPPLTREIARTTICWDKCPPRNTTAYVTAIDPGYTSWAQAPGVHYDALDVKLQLEPGYYHWPGINLRTSNQQIMELLLALNGDPEGTREVACQVFYDASSRSSGGGSSNGEVTRWRQDNDGAEVVDYDDEDEDYGDESGGGGEMKRPNY